MSTAMNRAQQNLTEQGKSHKAFGFGLPHSEEVEFALWHASCCIALARSIVCANADDLFVERFRFERMKTVLRHLERARIELDAAGEQLA